MLNGADPVADAAFLLMRHAGSEMWPDSPAEQRRLLRRARTRVHPDRSGTRTDWNAVEDAAKLLGLSSGTGAA